MDLSSILVALKLSGNTSMSWGWILLPFGIGLIYACIMQYLWYKSPEQKRFRENCKKIKTFLNKQ